MIGRLRAFQTGERYSPSCGVLGPDGPEGAVAPSFLPPRLVPGGKGGEIYSLPYSPSRSMVRRENGEGKYRCGKEFPR